MEYTTNLGLKKPAYSDPADIVDINDNMDILDQAVLNNAPISNNIWNGQYIDKKLVSFNPAGNYLIDYDNSLLIGYFPVEEGKTYTFKNGNYKIGAIAFVNENKEAVCAIEHNGGSYGGGNNFWTEVDGLVDVSGNYTQKTVTILEGSNIAYMLWYLTNGATNYIGSHTDSDLLTFLAQIQVNEGAELLDYEPTSDVTQFLKELWKTYNKTYNKTSNMYLTKQNNKIQVRSKFTNENDLAIRCTLNGSHNLAFNFDNYYLVNKNVPHTDISTGTLWKGANDDITPINFNGSYRGANHGDDRCFELVFSSAHGLTEANIGQRWKDSNDYECVIVRIVSTTKIWVVFPKPNMVSNDSCFYNTVPVSPITFNGTSKAFSSYTRTQLTPNENFVSVKAILNGNEVTQDGVYNAKFVDIVESYNLLYLPAMVSYLEAHVGENTNESYYSNAITEKYCTVNNVYRFTERGAITQFQSIDWDKAVNLNYAGMIQSSSIGDYYFVPDTEKELITDFDQTVEFDFMKDTWNDSDVPPTRFYQYADQAMNKGICIGYNAEFGDAKPSTRKDINQAGFIYTTKKVYPYLLDSNRQIAAGDIISSVAFRVPMAKYDDDIPSIGWYYVNDDIYLLIDVQHTVNKTVKLPNEMIGKKIAVVETSGTINLPYEFVGSNGIKIVVTNYGSAVVKLTD